MQTVSSSFFSITSYFSKNKHFDYRNNTNNKNQAEIEEKGHDTV